MKSLLTILLLVISNVFMTLAWYGHLKFKEYPWFAKLGLLAIILISWGLAFFEYIFQVPANKIGFRGNGGPFTLFQLKILQEVITLIVFTVFAILLFKNESFRWNHLVAFIFLVLAVVFVFWNKDQLH
ncbi:MAG: DMT family protein [Flavobacteriales bacterium]|nr:DMT family protein [Flavobacteriales bacterium]